MLVPKDQRCGLYALPQLIGVDSPARVLVEPVHDMCEVSGRERGRARSQTSACVFDKPVGAVHASQRGVVKVGLRQAQASSAVSHFVRHCQPRPAPDRNSPPG